MIRDKRVVALFVVSFLLTALILIGYSFGALRSLELSSVDKRFQIRGATQSSATKDIVLVNIDDTSFSDLNLQWPFPRSAHAALIDELSAAGAKVIAYDIQFTEPSDDPAEDEALIESIRKAGNVVLASSEVNEQGETRVLGGDEMVKEVNATVGDTIFPFDTGNVIRRFEYERQGVHTFGVATAERAGVKVSPSEFGTHGKAWLDFAGPPGTIDGVSFSHVLDGKVPRSYFKDKIVAVGVTVPTLHDQYRTSTSGADVMDGVEIQANSIGTILDDFPLTGAPWGFNVLLILLLGLMTPLASLKLNPRGAFAVALSAAIIFTIFAIASFFLGWIVVYVYPMLALVLSAIAALGVNFVSASFERERVRDIFARFVSDSVVEQVLRESGDGVKLGGKRIETTVLFSDLRSFTTFAEKIEPEVVIEVLNRYLTEMSDAILDEQGTLVSYMGDGIMAVFGAPLEIDDHADRAVAASRNMLFRMHDFNAWMQEQGLGEGFKMGIGLNTGHVMSGNVGSERRLEYTAIGDTTNTAARLEGATKGTPYQLFMAESTRDALTVKPDDVEFVDELPIRGRDEGVRVWGLVEPAPADVSVHA